jgi:hypothetical protein
VSGVAGEHGFPAQVVVWAAVQAAQLTAAYVFRYESLAIHFARGCRFEYCTCHRRRHWESHNEESLWRRAGESYPELAAKLY